MIDPRLNFNNNVQLVFALLKGGPKHPITASLQSDRAILVPNGAPIHIAGQTARARPADIAPVNANLVPEQHPPSPSPQSWAETDLKNPVPEPWTRTADEPGPITVGVAVQERAPGEPPRVANHRLARASPGSSCSRAGRWPTTSFRASSRPTSTWS